MPLLRKTFEPTSRLHPSCSVNLLAFPVKWDEGGIGLIAALDGTGNDMASVATGEDLT